MPGVKWTKDQLDDFKKRGGSVDGERGGQPKQGKPLIEVLFPERNAGAGEEDEGDGLNKTEREFHEWLKREFAQFHAIIYTQEIRLRLAKKTWYLPDFIVFTDHHTKVFEVKGFMRDDAAVKLKVAANKYRNFQFWLVTKKRMRDGGGWEFKRVEP